VPLGQSLLFPLFSISLITLACACQDFFNFSMEDGRTIHHPDARTALVASYAVLTTAPSIPNYKDSKNLGESNDLKFD
jgi:hypothetical protein